MAADLFKVKELFLAVLEVPAPERATYLDTACSGDTALRRQIEAMLQSHQKSGELLPRTPAEMLHSSVTQVDAVPPPITTSGEDSAATDRPATTEVNLSFLSPSDKPDQLGTLGRYDVQKVLGQGGFGIVLKGFDERLHRVVAVKVLSPAYAANGSARKRFIREARAAAAVKNEHVVGIHDVQESAEPPYLVMEYVDGISLQDKIDKHGPLGVKEILRIGMQIAEGLSAAHKQGLVHRDIKPANILLENGVERVKITDFGLARAVDDASVTQSGTVTGTPMYMSPEQAEGLPLDHRSDLFSLGTVLYAMCTGHPPFRAAGTLAVLMRVVDASPRPIRENNSEIPDWLCDIIAKLHAKKPEDRFQTAKELAELLGRHLADVQAGRAIERAPHVSGGSAAATSAARTPPAGGSPNAGGSPKPARRPWIKAMALATTGGAFTLAAGRLFHLPAGQVSPPGVQWLVAAVGMGLLAAAVFVGFNARRWRFSVTALLLLTAVTFLFVRSHSHSLYPVVVEADDPTTVVRIWPTAQPEPPVNPDDPNVLLGTPLHEFSVGHWTEVLLPAGNFWVTAELEGREVHRVFLKIEDTRFVIYQREEEHGNRGPVLSYVSNTTLGRTKRLIIPAAANLRKLATDGWVPLFNGKDLSGWKTHKDQPGDWGVKDGMLTCTGPVCHLFTEKGTYANFHLRFDVKLASGTTSAVFFRSPLDDLLPGKIGTYPAGYQVHLAEVTSRGALAYNGIVLAASQDAPMAQEWNRYEIIAADNQLQIKVNGETVTRFTDRDQRLARGHIALRHSGGKNTVYFRNIEIKDLPPPTAEPDWVPLFNGKDLLGWKQLHPDQAKWEIVDGILIGKGKHDFLHTVRDDYVNFHLRFESKIVMGDRALLFRAVATKFNNEYNGFQLETTNVNKDMQVSLSTTKFGPLMNDFGPGHATDLAGQAADWHIVDVIAKGDHIQVLVNGKPAFSFTDAQRMHPRGCIGVFVGSQISKSFETHIRKIQIKELPPEPAAQELAIRAERLGILKALGVAFHSYHDLNGKAPADAAALKPFLEGNEKAWLALNDNSLVFFFNVGLKQMAQGASNTVVAFDTQAPASGGHVLMADGLVRYVTPAQFTELALARPRPERSWVQLFNGKDLKGWSVGQGNWEVLDGVLTGTVTAGKSGNIGSDRLDFANFHLLAEVRIKGAGISNLIVGDIGVAIEEKSTGSIALFRNTAKPEWLQFKENTLVEPGAWLTLELIADGPNVISKVNGQEVARIKESTRKPGGVALYLRGKPGPVVVEFRKIQIKVPPPSEPAFVPLFNGKDLTGWKSFGNSKTESGELVLWPTGAVDTIDSLPRRFHLRMDVKLKQGQATVRFHANERAVKDPQPAPTDGWFLNLTENPVDVGAIDAELVIKSHADKIGPSRTSGVAKLGEWFRLEVIAEDDQTEILVNGYRMAGLAHKRLPHAAGVISLWNNGYGQSRIAFRNIEFKDLTPADEGRWVPLFNGKDLTGWTPTKYWRVKDGLLTAKVPGDVGGSSSGPIHPGSGHFHLRLEGKLGADTRMSVGFDESRMSVAFGPRRLYRQPVFELTNQLIRLSMALDLDAKTQMNVTKEIASVNKPLAACDAPLEMSAFCGH